MSRWLTIDEAARYFGVSRRTVSRRISSGEWPTTVLPGMCNRRFSPADIAQIESQAMKTPPHEELGSDSCEGDVSPAAGESAGK